MMIRQSKRASRCASVVTLAIALAACSVWLPLHAKGAVANQETQAKESPVSGGHEHHHAAHAAHAVHAAPVAVDPAATLQPDAFDAPAPTAVEEAAKAAGGEEHAGHSHQEQR
jgi:hypothetical protein